MKYMGSKRRIAAQIAPIINAFNSDIYIEPFVGGFNLTPFIEKPVIFAGDNDPGLISLYKALQSGWLPPELITEEMYFDIKNNKQNYPLELVSYVGYSLSFGGKYFGGYRRDKAGDCSSENEEKQSKRAFDSIVKQASTRQFKEANFFDLDYSMSVGYVEWLGYKKPYVVYCDPPYFGVTGYKLKFDTSKFWEWVRGVSLENYVIVSEYVAPKDFDVLWCGGLSNTLNKDGSSSVSEKLFIWGGKNAS